MNSSMKQPPPAGVSLNDCLLKGPLALVDLYTMTLGMREHKVAFTKDISKFYQCVEADTAACSTSVLRQTQQLSTSEESCGGLGTWKWIRSYSPPLSFTRGTDLQGA
jgi:hypothetical protein